MKKITSFCLTFCLFALTLRAQVVISEIMYNPPEAGTDSLEYVEIFNAGSAAVNLDGWKLSGVDLTFSGISINPGQSILTALRPSAMQSLFGKTAIGWTGGALTNAGETLKILDAAGATVDEVAYDDAAPWPTDAAGNGFSLELCNPLADNTLASNWKAANHNTGVSINNRPVFATPGAANTVNCFPDADRSVSVQDFFFSPADITINQGESVIWICQQGTHNVNGSLATFPQNPEGFSSGAPKLAPWFLVDTFDVPGVYSYRCDPHTNMGMNGKVTVLPKPPVKIAITEFMYNDPGADSLEFVEIYNNGTVVEDISGWVFTQGIEYVFPAGTTINPGQYLVIAKFADAFAANFGFSTPYQFAGALVNTGEDIELRNAQNEVVDYFDYLAAAPWPAEANGNGSSVVLCDPNSDNGQPGAWRAATTQAGFALGGIDVLANPGGESGCPTNIDTQDDILNALSGQPATFNPLTNDFLPNPVTSLTISTPALHGTATVNAGNTITYVSAPGFCGNDQFKYTVGDGQTTGVATVDVVVKCYPKYGIPTVSGEDADGIADSVGIYCEVSATVHGVNLRAGLGLNFFIIDDASNNGINVFRNDGSAGYAVLEGDHISVRGRIDQFRGLTEIVVDEITKNSAGNPLVTPLTVLVPAESTESKLIKINNLHLVNPGEWTTGSGNGGFNVRAVSDDHPTDTVSIRIDNDVDLYNEPAPAYPFHLTGIGGQNDTNQPYTSGYQILPRYKSDMDLIIATDEADFSRSVRISPNPASGKVVLRSDFAFDQVQVFSAQGQLMRTLLEPDLEESIDLQGFGSGVYFLRFEKDGAAWTGRLVKI